MDEIKEQKAEEIKEKIGNIMNLDKIADLLKSNEKEFIIGGITYKVRKPNAYEKQEAYKKRIEKYVELLKDDKYSLEEDLKNIYLKRGIDIDKMNSDMNFLNKTKETFMEKLGAALANKAGDAETENYKKEIETLNNQIYDISNKKTRLLEFSIENQVLIHTISYLTFLITEKKEGESWVKVWKTWENFIDGDSDLVNMASYYTTFISSIEPEM